MNTFNLTLRTRTNKSGTLPLYFISTLNRKSSFKSLGFSLSVNEWDAANQQFYKPSALALKIAEIKQRATTLQLKLRLENKIISKEDFLSAIFEDSPKKNKGSDFFIFYDRFLAQKDYPLKHVKSYNTLKDQLQAFNKNACFNIINYGFCTDFAGFLRTKYGNSNNTRIKKIQYLRCILGEAVKHGYLKTNPASDVKIKSEKTNRSALTKEDLQKIEKLYTEKTLPQSTQNVLHYFLFCCYTGLRFGDLVKFSISDIRNNVIKITQSKTNGVVSIPLIPQAVALLPDYKFTVLSNQKSNAHLKKIKAAAGITIKMSCHIARHTFATIGLNSGIPLEVVSEVLGHSSTRVTKIYAKMLDDFKTVQLQKWGL